MIRYVMTMNGISNEEDAKSFFLSQLLIDHGHNAMALAMSRGFRRVLMCRPAVQEHITTRIENMHLRSPNEFLWMGPDESGATYIFYGLIENELDRSM